MSEKQHDEKAKAEHEPLTGPVWLRPGGQHVQDLRDVPDKFTLPNGTVVTKEGIKFDAGKLRMDLLPPDALEALARILTDGEMVAHIPGYDSYLATSAGNIFSLHRLRFLTPDKIWCGYLRVKLNGNKNELVHRLVLSAFSGRFRSFVNHKNGNKADNRLENLEWCTKSQNTKHAYRLGLQRARSGHEVYNAKFTEREAKVIRGLYKMGATQAEIGELFGVRQANISDIVRGKCYKER